MACANGPSTPPFDILTSKRGLESVYEPMVDAGYVPDFMLRAGIRKLLADRLRMSETGTIDGNEQDKQDYVAKLKAVDKIALHTKEANEQHYEVPTEFFHMCLGKRKKYSGCLYSPGVVTLDQAEELMLASYCEKAQLVDGLKIMDLGCGWGSLTLYLAEVHCEKRANKQ
jgi:cyclopropane-fatty-acyl-phospholipid synthase